jgi:hypothetical protein
VGRQATDADRATKEAATAMKYKIEAVAEPQWMPEFDDPEANPEAEQEHMRKAEVQHITEAGIDASKIRWIEWEVVGYEEAVWTIETDEDTRNALEAAGWLILDDDPKAA